MRLAALTIGNSGSPEYTRTVPMVHPAVDLTVLAAGATLCLVRLWWMWWQNDCGGCGLRRSACACGPGEHMMRPRR